MSQREATGTYRTRLLVFLCYEQEQLEAERLRICERLHELREHIAALVEDKNGRAELRVEGAYRRMRQRNGG